MASSLTITTNITSDEKWEIIGSIIPGGSLPVDIFIYENTGTSALGNYVGVCGLEELQRLAIYDGSAVPIFGNRYLRYHQAKISIGIEDDPVLIQTHLINTVSALSVSLKNFISAVQTIIID